MTTISFRGKADGIIMSPKQRDNTTPRIDIVALHMECLCFLWILYEKLEYREYFRRDEADFGMKLRKRIFFAGVIINQTSG